MKTPLKIPFYHPKKNLLIPLKTKKQNYNKNYPSLEFIYKKTTFIKTILLIGDTIVYRITALEI